MKSYTDISQSKKLAEILPLESADHFHIIGHLHTDDPRYEVIRSKNEVSDHDGGINALVTRDIEIPYGAKDSELQEVSYYIPEGYYAHIDDDKVIIKRRSKSALEAIKEEKVDNTNKIEPKFHEGEWITNGDYTWKIVEVKPLDYILQSQDGNIVDDTISHVDEQFHSFTIQDAKDGDVLADKYNNIGIFQECKGICWHSYIYLGCDGELRGFNIGGSHEQTGTHPATKEQREQLEKAMADAGYEWDAEKKELKHDENE